MRGKVDMDMQAERIKGILGKDCKRTAPNTLRFLKFLQRNVKAHCLLTGTEEFEWERDFLAGGWGGAEYEKMKVERSSFVDQFELEALIAPDADGQDIVARVKRLTDQKDFKIGLSLLEGLDFNDESFQFIDDYVAWFKHY